MNRRRIVSSIIIMTVMVILSVNAGGKNDLQKHFNAVAIKVQAAENPSEKRMLMNESFQSMRKALDIVQQSPVITQGDRVVLEQFAASLKAKHDELLGINDYTRVPDNQLNAFSFYVVQDMEQADQMISISLVTLLLILILVVLIV